MSAVLKPSEANSRPLAASHSRPQRRLHVVSEPARSPASTAVPKLVQRDRPLWLKFLVVGQRLSLGMAAIAVTGALSAYALTVDSNRRLTAATATLGRLQDHQQQLTTANAVFKNHLAQTAINAVEDGTLHPKDVIFWEAADPTPAADGTSAEPEETSPPDPRFFPKGY